MGKGRKMGWMGWSFIVLLGLAVLAFAAWRVALALGTADTLNTLDSYYSRERASELAAQTRYGEREDQRIELYVPTPADGAPADGIEESGKHPVILFVHGGSWNFGKPEEYRFIARTFGDLGYATALISYRLVPGGEFPAMLEDTAASVRWLIDNAEAHDLDKQNIYLMGHSAGAYNVLMTGLDRQWLGREGLPDDAVKGVISLAGPADFYPFDSDSTKAAFGGADQPEKTQPVTFARADGPPLLLLHGADDTTVYPRNSENLHQLVTQAGGISEMEIYPEMDHAKIVMRFSRPFEKDRKLIERVDSFIKQANLTRASAPVQAAVP